MKYEIIPRDEDFFLFSTVRNFSDTEYNQFVEKVSRVRFVKSDTPRTLRFYCAKDDRDNVRKLIMAIAPNFKDYYDKVENKGSSNSSADPWRVSYFFKDRKTVDDGAARWWEEYFQKIISNGKIVRFDNTNLLKGYTSNGTVVMLTAAPGNPTWVAEQNKITSNSTYDADKAQKELGLEGLGNNNSGGNNGGAQSLLTPTNLLIAGAVILGLFLLLRKKKPATP